MYRDLSVPVDMYQLKLLLVHNLDVSSLIDLYRFILIKYCKMES